MSDSSDLSTKDGVLSYVAETQFDCTTATPLTGGFGNYVFRLRLRTPYQGHSTVVLKHAKPYVPGLKELAFSLDRQVYEVAALREMRARLPKTSIVTVPEVLLFDETASVIVMSDCGEATLPLKQLLQDSPPSTEVACRMGAALGEFIGNLHSRGRDDKDFREFFGRNVDGKKISAFATYGRLVSTLTDGQLPALSDPPLDIAQKELDAIAQISEDVERAILTTDETVVMGDFWPGNVLVALRQDGKESTAEIERIYVVDWEMSKTGLAGLDVGQFCAELHLLRSFKPESKDAASTLLTSFLRAYGQTCQPDTGLDLARTAIVHVGAHLVAWTPRIPWGIKERVREVVRKGVEYLVEGTNATEGYIRNSIVAALLH